eukprot:m.34263 g.34263  ORF g.34263 m.34263 type:complete len:316 (+) comp8695_c0_seq1:103-1050(+)
MLNPAPRLLPSLVGTVRSKVFKSSLFNRPLQQVFVSTKTSLTMADERSPKRLRENSTDEGVMTSPPVPTTTRNKPLRIAVEGNIATGKSTFLDLITTHMPHLNVVQEPVHKWTNVEEDRDDDDEMPSSQKSGGNLLQLFYDKPERWAYTFQTYAFLSRMKSQVRNDMDTSASVTIFERSVFSDRVCFAANCHDSGLLSDIEYTVYCDFHSFLVESLARLEVDGIIYLRSNTETCMKRLEKRNRTEEKTIPKDYLEALEKRHDDWLLHKTVTVPGLSPDTPVLVLDTNEEFETNEANRKKVLGQTQTFIESLKRVD